MKTIEEKARAYDEAIRKAAALYKASEPMSGCNVIIETLFPEIKESEDEKIRKWIVDDITFNMNNEPLNNSEYRKKAEKAIAWLEKQGQVKESTISQHENKTCEENGNSLTYEDERIRKEIINYFQCQSEEEPTRKEIHNKWIAWLENIPVAIDHEKREGFHLGYREALDYAGGFCVLKKNEQRMVSAEESLGIDSGTYNKIVDECIFGEQKPADTVAPKFKVGDKIYLKPEYRMPDDDTPIANTVKEIRRIDDKHYRFDGSYIFIEDQDKYELVEQKPDWSEEDEKMLDSVIGDILCADTLIGGIETASYKCDWLKSLKERIGGKV